MRLILYKILFVKKENRAPGTFIRNYTRARNKTHIFIFIMPISSPNPFFDHLLESSLWDDSNKWSNIGFGEELTQVILIEVYSTHLILCSEYPTHVYFLRLEQGTDILDLPNMTWREQSWTHTVSSLPLWSWSESELQITLHTIIINIFSDITFNLKTVLCCDLLL